MDNLHEPAHRQLMRLYAMADQRAAGLRQYRECVRILDEELGVPPLDETTELYEAIQTHQLAPPPIPSPVQISPPAPTRLPLVGRDAEWGQMQAIWHEAGQSQAGHGRLLVLTGEAGIGKSRLLNELLAHAQSQRAITALARCFPGENSLAFGPLLEALTPLLATGPGRAGVASLPDWQQSEVARLFPSLLWELGDLPPAPPLDSPGGQARFFQALAALLAALLQGDTPGVLAFDDLHWADSATLDLLTWLWPAVCTDSLSAWPWPGAAGKAMKPPCNPCPRPPSATEQAHSYSLAVCRRRMWYVWFRVEHKFRESTRPVGEFPQSPRSIPEVAPWPVVSTQRAKEFPFYWPSNWHFWRMPGRAARNPVLPRPACANFSPAGWRVWTGMAAQVLSAAAIIGRSFDLETVQAAAGRSEEESLVGLEALLQRRLVVEQPAETAGSLPRYDFCHEKLRELVYDETALARRRLLHRRVAESFSRRIGRQLGAAAQSAFHHRWAGQEEEAARLYTLAGDEARQLYANAEALVHYRTALALGHPETARLHRTIGELLTLRGEYAGALLALEQAASALSGAALTGVEEQIGGVYQRQGEWRRAEEHYRAGLDTLPDGDFPALRARLLTARSHTAHRLGDDAQAEALAEEAQVLAVAGKDAQAQADVLNLLGLLARSRGNGAGVIGHLQASLAAAAALDNPSAEIAARNNLALALADGGDFVPAQEHLLAALARCAAWGDRHREAALRNNLADLLHRMGKEEGAMEQLKEAVTIFTEIGESGRLPTNAEIWKLAEW